MAVVLFLVAFLIACGLASAMGWTADTRDPDYSLGRIIDPRAASDTKSR
jgi:hypothetical protein